MGLVILGLVIFGLVILGLVILGLVILGLVLFISPESNSSGGGISFLGGRNSIPRDHKCKGAKCSFKRKNPPRSEVFSYLSFAVFFEHVVACLWRKA